MDWFRLYAEFASDPKVQMMSEAMQRRLVMLMCLQCSNGIETFHETERDSALAFAMRISDEDLAETKALFLRKGFINEDWTLRNWSKRQYASDSSTERVRAHRERKKHGSKRDETLQERSSNAPEQNRTEQNRTEEKKETQGAGAPGVSGSGPADENSDSGGSASTPPSSPADDPPTGATAVEKNLGLRELVADGVDRQHAEDWLKVRRAKRAPLTATAWDDVKHEAAKAGITPAEAVRISATNSWQGFKASWLDKATQQARASPGIAERNRQAAEEAKRMIFGGG